MTALIERRDAITDLGVLPGGAVSVARAIHRLVWVVGEAELPGGFHAFVYSPQATWLLGRELTGAPAELAETGRRQPASDSEEFPSGAARG